MEVRERMYLDKEEKVKLIGVIGNYNTEELIDHIEGLLYKAYCKGKDPYKPVQTRYDPNDPRFGPGAGMIYLKDGNPSEGMNIKTKHNYTDNPPGYHADVCKVTPQ